MCTHNGARFVREQVASILRQSRAPDQLLVSDDASTDDTVASVRDEVARHLRANPGQALDLVVIENPRALGVVKNFEQAVTACSGDLIALCDQDDVWHENRIALAVEQFEARPELSLLHANARLVDGDGLPLGYSLFDAIALSPSEIAEIHDGRALDALLRRNVVTGATTMLRASLLEHALPFFEPWVHDEWLAVVASIVGRVDVLGDEIIDYRQHGANEIGARKLAFGGKIAQLRHDRAARSRYLVHRAEALHARLVQLGGVPPHVLELVERKVEHERRRRDLPRFRPARIPAVIREMRTGNYARFGRPRYDILRDLLQPGA